MPKNDVTRNGYGFIRFGNLHLHFANMEKVSVVTLQNAFLWGTTMQSL